MKRQVALGQRSFAAPKARIEHAPQAARALTRHLAWSLCLAMLLLLGGTLLSVLPQKTITTDEFVHIPAASAYLGRRDFSLNSEHPSFSKLIAALPLLIIQPVQPPVRTDQPPTNRTVTYAQAFWDANADRFTLISFWTRVPMIAFTLSLGLLIFLATRRLFGARAALLAVALFVLEPTVLAHGRVVHTDIPAAFAYFGCCMALAYYVAQPTLRRALLLGLATGVALVTKANLLIVLPVVAPALAICWLLAPRRGWSRRSIVAHAALLVPLLVLLINAAYLFRHQPLAVSDLAWAHRDDPAGADRALAIIDRLSPILPPYYTFGIYEQLVHNAEGHPAGLLGQYSQHGWWYYFPVAFALKSTLPFLALTGAAIVWAFWCIAFRRDLRVALVLAPCLLFVAYAMSGQINIGIRHLLPAYPFLFMLAGALLDRLLRWRPWRLAAPLLTAILLGWMLVEAVRTYPNYMSYMNQLACCEPHWYYLSDSNIEWGDDTVALATYLREHGEHRVNAAVAGAPNTLKYYGVEYVNLFIDQDTSIRYVAIGASFLNGSTLQVLGGWSNPDYFNEYRYRRPEAILGNGSIYLYRSRDPLAALTGPLPDGGYQATITAHNLPTHLQAGQQVMVRVHVQNDSAITWPAAIRGRDEYQIRVGDRWLDPATGAIVRDDARTPVNFDVDPGDGGEFRVVITAPATPGNYLLQIDLVQEAVTWFGARGSTPVQAPIRVGP